MSRLKTPDAPKRSPGRPRKADAMTAAERNRLARAKRAGSVTLTPEAAAALDRLRRDGETRAATVARVLAEAAE